MGKKGVMLVLLGVIALVSSSYVLGCSCAQQNVQEAFRDSDAIFSGKVSGITMLEEGSNELRVSMQVSKVWKGADSGSIIVKTVKDAPSCGYSFVKGEQYLVYARTGGIDSGDKWGYWVNLCSRTKRLADSGDDVKQLGELAKTQVKEESSIEPSDDEEREMIEEGIISAPTAEEKQQEKGFFAGLWEWIKGLFS